MKLSSLNRQMEKRQTAAHLIQKVIQTANMKGTQERKMALPEPFLMRLLAGIGMTVHPLSGQ
jgi:hypothetical protein